MKIRMSHKELIIWLSKETPDSKIFDAFDDKTVNDVLSVPIIPQTFVKTEIALLHNKF